LRVSRPPATAAMGVPQARQNLARVGFCSPHTPQATMGKSLGQARRRQAAAGRVPTPAQARRDLAGCRPARARRCLAGGRPARTLAYRESSKTRACSRSSVPDQEAVASLTRTPGGRAVKAQPGGAVTATRAWSGRTVAWGRSSSR
jgi:hypothetical protein